MHLIQILLPLYNQDNNVFPEIYFTQIKTQLTEKLGGITTYSRSPATGFWKETDNKTVKDEIIVYKIMAPDLDRVWWQTYKQQLEKLFNQDEIIIRASAIDIL